MDLLTTIKEHRQEILRIGGEHGASEIRIFGSIARGESGPTSDIDVLVRLDRGRSLLDVVAIKQDLEDLLGCPVDVVTEASLSPYIRSKVIGEAIAV